MLTYLYRATLVRALMLSEKLRDLIMRAVGVSTTLVSPMSMATGDLADMANRAAQGATALQTSALTFLQLFGLLAFAGGIIALKSMKNNPQVKPWMVALSIIGGLLLMGIPELIKRAMTQIGLTPVSVG